MSDMWVDLLPVLLAMMISPARTLAVILLLHTPRSPLTPFSYVLGMATAMLAQGAALGAALSIIGLTSPDRSGDLSIVVGALFLAGGAILLAGAFKIAAAPSAGGGSLASALERLERLGPGGAYKIGFGWILASPKQWVFVLTAVAVIFTAQLTTVGSLANYLVFTFLVQIVYFAIIGSYVLVQDRVSASLDSAFEWIKRNLRVTAIALFTGFGVVFLVKGLATLSG